MMECIFTLVDDEGAPVKIVITMPDGRTLDFQPVGEVTRLEARVICGSVMNTIRAGLRADQFRHGVALDERPRVPISKPETPNG
jgi:hypothetical protein